MFLVRGTGQLYLAARGSREAASDPSQGPPSGVTRLCFNQLTFHPRLAPATSKIPAPLTPQFPGRKKLPEFFRAGNGIKDKTPRRQQGVGLVIPNLPSPFLQLQWAWGKPLLQAVPMEESPDLSSGPLRWEMPWAAAYRQVRETQRRKQNKIPERRSSGHSLSELRYSGHSRRHRGPVHGGTLPSQG